ncbi:MAG: hypothetical protein ACE5JD_11945 [Candidatus Methylomirabilia bacterium]
MAEEFRQARTDYARKREGTGLGLTLVQGASDQIAQDLGRDLPS